MNNFLYQSVKVGSRRLRPPEAITEPLGEYNATHNAFICPQFILDVSGYPEITAEIGQFVNTPLLQKTLGESEDCLYLNIYRPKNTKPGDKLPVLYWIFGGGFELGWNTMYDGTPWVEASVAQEQPIIFVTVNYRVAGFGFLPGKEVKEDGAGNLGLVDQRRGLEWVSDNIEAFGGDPDRVTIWGESAGAISVFDQTVLYDGDNTYRGKPLFRAGIMNSGNAYPASDIDGDKGQGVYDKVVEVAGCSGEEDTLNCLRGLDYYTFLNATTSVSGILSYASDALNYLPRPDGKVLTQSPDALIKSGKYAHVPFIIGDQEDEGTLFSLVQTNITTEDELVEYLHGYYYWNLTPNLAHEFISHYANDEVDGSPFGTGALYRIYPQFKRLAAILGDIVFTITRRVVLEILAEQSPQVPTWSYLSSYDKGTPVLGTMHGSDITQVIYGIKPDYAGDSFSNYYISFVNHLDPNKGTGSKFLHWPQWKENHQLLHTYADHADYLPDDFRSGSADFIRGHLQNFYI